jgi:hypothetical protein
MFRDRIECRGVGSHGVFMADPDITLKSENINPCSPIFITYMSALVRERQIDQLESMDEG